MTKQDFVQEFSQLLSKAGIQNVHHIEWDDLNEEAIVYYNTLMGNGQLSTRTINCKMDSLFGILVDISNHV